MSPLDLASLDPSRVPALDGSPTQALLDLSRAARARVPLVVMHADPNADRALDDPRATVADRLAADPQTRLIGPASAGLFAGPGRVALVTAMGPLVPPMLRALGDRLGLAIDLGLAWDVGAAEILATLAAGPFEVIGLAVPDTALGPALARSLRQVQGRVAVFALACGQAALALSRYDVACVADLAALVRALAADVRPSGRRVAVVTGTGPLGDLVPAALSAAGLTLTAPSAVTAAHLASELPLRTTLDPLVRIPGATTRHVETARTALASDPTVDHVLALDVPGHPARDPFAEAAHLAHLAAASHALAAGPSPLIADADGHPRVEALVAASLLMRRARLDHTATTSLLTAFDDTLASAPAVPVASLAAARQAARQVGYPVLLAPSLTPIADDAGLVERWESLLEASRIAPAPLTARDADPFAARVVVHAAAAPRALTYSAGPLPFVDLGDRTLALPLRERDLEAHPATLRPALRALSHLCQHAPDVASIALLLGADGTLLFAEATLGPLDATG